MLQQQRCAPCNPGLEYVSASRAVATNGICAMVQLGGFVVREGVLAAPYQPEPVGGRHAQSGVS
jgi:hypothetical protein